MKGFLFDENLPRVASPQTSLPVTHALDLGARPTDSQLWAHAEQNDLAIVTKDADFSQRIVLGVPPPRVIHLRVGNMRGREFAVWPGSPLSARRFQVSASQRFILVLRSQVLEYSLTILPFPPADSVIATLTVRWLEGSIEV